MEKPGTMTRLHELSHPIPEAELPEWRQALAKVQGNILRGHGRNHAIHIFLAFTAEERAARQWLRQVAARVTSAQQQLEDADEYRQYGIPGRLFVSVLLAAAGYRYLGMDLAGYSPEFSAGMQGAGTRLHDPAVETWEEGYQQPMHAMVLLADDDEGFLWRETRQLLDDLKPVAALRAVEYGHALRNAHGHHIEHFGYVDGRSQPLFFQRDVMREAAMEGTEQWDPGAGPNLALMKEPGSGENDVGSYVVFRKLEQNVRGFKAREAELANALGLSGAEAERAGALAVGRFEDGTPVVLQRTAGLSDPVPNNFTYADDPEGQRCPFHAHIRKVNPRGELAKELEEPQNIERQHRIARRGIPYGVRAKEPKDDPGLDEVPTGGVGLLFMCYQRDIGKQFEFLQSKWASNEDFLQDATGLDPIIGQPGPRTPIPQQWPAQWDAPRQAHQPFSFHGFVTLKGGEYFFAPSIKFLESL
jgi:Dyp-type peroxidase family